MSKDFSPFPLVEDEFSYFVKFDQLANIVCSISDHKYPLKDSAYVSVDEVFPEDKGK